ncbi:MAG: cyclic nucleotide-binding domain-containing protein [Deltaproteobacteria bacterium]|nr:cyclic nucleotide-binding domain-containing protein [Deltaproteobacteria bacterium]
MKSTIIKESKLRKYKDKAQNYYEKGKYNKALSIYSDILEAFPDDHNIMIKIGDLCRKMNLPEDAKKVYLMAIEHYSCDGKLLQAIALCRVVLEMFPDDAETRNIQTELHNRKYGLKLPSLAPAPLAEIEPDELDSDEIEIDTDEVLELSISFDEIEEYDLEEDEPGEIPDDDDDDDDEIIEVLEPVDGDKNIVVRMTRPSVVVEELPHIPLFSGLGEDTFNALVKQLDLKEYAPLETIINDGEEGDSFFIIISGSVEIFKNEESLAVLEEGAFFGEMAVIVPGVRQATVVAAEPCRMFEITNKQLRALKDEFPDVEADLIRFAEERLLNNLMLTSPLFTPFTRDEQKSLMEKFDPFFYKKDQDIVVQGNMPEGMFLLVSGEASVTGKDKDENKIEIARLYPGDIFGEISLLTKKSATATVTTLTDSRMLMLPRSRFNELIMTHPQILEIIASISEERLKQLEQIKKRPLASSKGEGTALL